MSISFLFSFAFHFFSLHRYLKGLLRQPFCFCKMSTNNKCWRGCVKRELSYTVDGNANWYSHYGERCGDSLKKLEIELSYVPTILLLGIHTEETRIERDMCTPMFITALFIIARTWKQPRCPSADEWIRKLWYL